MAEKSYTRFVINGKEQELKFCLQALRLLDENGGPMQFVSQTMQGGITNFTDVVYYALIHTNEGITYEAVQKEIENMFNAEKLDLDEILKYNKAVVLNSFSSEDSEETSRDNDSGTTEIVREPVRINIDELQGECFRF